MPLWKKLWLLFATIWVIVAGLNAATILAFAEDTEREKAVTPIALGVVVPAVIYALAWLWQRWRKKGSDPEIGA